VRIYLPARDPLANGSGEDRPAADVGDSEVAAHHGKMLVVEDETEVRSQIADALNGIGYTVVEAGDGTSGLRVLESGEPLDLLITDVGLPGLSGVRLAEAARVWRPGLPILLITGYVGRTLESMRLAPNIEILRKPFTLDELAARVAALLKGAAGV
jgi:DNA-binding response OmpR family regulator